MINNKFEKLIFNEVISIEKKLFARLLYTFKVQELINEYKSNFSGGLEAIFLEGIKVEVLRLGSKEWQKGKIKFTLEFCPDEPELKQSEVEESTFNAEVLKNSLRQKKRGQKIVFCPLSNKK